MPHNVIKRIYKLKMKGVIMATAKRATAKSFGLLKPADGVIPANKPLLISNVDYVGLFKFAPISGLKKDVQATVLNTDSRWNGYHVDFNSTKMTDPSGKDVLKKGQTVIVPMEELAGEIVAAGKSPDILFKNGKFNYDLSWHLDAKHRATFPEQN